MSHIATQSARFSARVCSEQARASASRLHGDATSCGLITVPAKTSSNPLRRQVGGGGRYALRAAAPFGLNQCLSTDRNQARVDGARSGISTFMEKLLRLNPDSSKHVNGEPGN
jgi:hypothetical protein